MDYHFVDKNSKAYSPQGIRNLFEQAVNNENGDIEAVLTNKHKYKNLLELWYASFLAFAIHKWLKRKFYLNTPNQDPPDILFLDENNKEAFPVEIAELFIYRQTVFEGGYKKLVQQIWKAKGSANLNRCHLLLVNRIKSAKFNVSRFLVEMRKFDWKFERIWLGIFTADTFSWTFFDIFPFEQNNSSSYISVSIRNQADMKYLYW